MVVAEGNNRNVVVVVVEGKQWKCGGGGITSFTIHEAVLKKGLCICGWKNV